MNTVYVVMGSCGEYSDRSEWPVRAFDSEGRAQGEVTRLSELARIYEEQKGAEEDFFEIEYDKPRFAAWRAEHVPGLSEADPDFDTSYPGTRYFVYEVPWGGP